MLASLIFTIAALLQNAAASRRFWPAAPPAQPVGLQAEVRVPRLQMQFPPLPPEDRFTRDIPEAWKPGMQDNWRERRVIKNKPVWLSNMPLPEFLKLPQETPIGVEPFEPSERGQRFPPPTARNLGVAKIDVKILLRTWRGFVEKSGVQRLDDVLAQTSSGGPDGLKDSAPAIRKGAGISPAGWRARQALAVKWQDMVSVLQKMESTNWRQLFTVMNANGTRVPADYLGFHQVDYNGGMVAEMFKDVVSAETVFSRQNHAFEVVALIPNDSFAHDASVMALGLFSRRTIVDNDNSSLLMMVEKQFGRETRLLHDSYRARLPTSRSGSPLMFMWPSLLSRRKRLISVFSIEGLAEAPDLSARSARVLLAKIAKWAQSEKRLVVVPRTEVHFKGADHTAYYKRLGFEEVAMDDGLYDLVYPAYRSVDEDQWIEDRQLMVRFDAL